MKKRFAHTSTAILVIAALVGITDSASAAPPSESGVVTRMPDIGGRVYADGGIVVISGPSFEDGCRGEGFSEPTVSFIARGNGSESSHFNFAPEPISVFEGEDAFAVIDAACGAIFDGDPATNPPAPLATGEGRLTEHFRVDTNGVVHVHNSVVGSVTTSDGRRAHVNASAKVTVEDAVPDVQLHVNYTG